jgi:hypothetical protein
MILCEGWRGLIEASRGLFRPYIFIDKIGGGGTDPYVFLRICGVGYGVWGLGKARELVGHGVRPPGTLVVYHGLS